MSKKTKAAIGVPEKVRVCRKWISGAKVDAWLEEFGWQYGERLISCDEVNLKRVRLDFFPESLTEERDYLRQHGGMVVELLPDVWWHPERADAEPLRFGKKILVVTGKEQESYWGTRLPGRKIVVIGSGMAFGTGQHETTAMCLRQLDACASRFVKRDGECGLVDCMDIGTGSGVLAIAAKKLGFKKVFAMDYDSIAVEVARENGHLNGVDVQWAVADVLNWKAPFQAVLVFANLFSGILISARRAISSAIRKGGMLVLSGIRLDQLEEVRSAYRDFEQVRRTSARGWVCLTLSKNKK